MEETKKGIGDFFKIEFNKEFLVSNWKRLAVLLALLIALLVGIFMGVKALTKEERQEYIRIKLTKVCRLGGEEMSSQYVDRMVPESQTEDAPRAVTVIGLCDNHLYTMAVKEEKIGDSRFYDNAVQIRAVKIEYMGQDEKGKRLVKVGGEEMALRLMKVLFEKYPEAEHYDIRVDHTHYDFNRGGVLIRKYGEYSGGAWKPQ